jgi:hypothetical protein
METSRPCPIKCSFLKLDPTFQLLDVPFNTFSISRGIECTLFFPDPTSPPPHPNPEINSTAELISKWSEAELTLKGAQA